MADTGLTERIEHGGVTGNLTVVPQDSSTVISSKARLSKLPVNDSINRTWKSVRIQSSDQIRSGLLWSDLSLSLSVIDGRGYVDVSGLQPGGYALFMWGCDLAGPTPTNCRWLTPRTFEVPQTPECEREGYRCYDLSQIGGEIDDHENIVNVSYQCRGEMTCVNVTDPCDPLPDLTTSVPGTVETNTTFLMNGSATDCGGSIDRVEWMVSRQKTGLDPDREPLINRTGEQVEVRVNETGPYQVRTTAIDEEGNRRTKTSVFQAQEQSPWSQASNQNVRKMCDELELSITTKKGQENLSLPIDNQRVISWDGQDVMETGKHGRTNLSVGGTGCGDARTLYITVDHHHSEKRRVERTIRIGSRGGTTTEAGYGHRWTESDSTIQQVADPETVEGETFLEENIRADVKYGGQYDIGIEIRGDDGNLINRVELSQEFHRELDRPRVVSGHRGAGHDIAPENTVMAVEKALELGVDLPEIDVMKTGTTGRFAVIHPDKPALYKEAKAGDLSRVIEDLGVETGVPPDFNAAQALQNIREFDLKTSEGTTGEDGVIRQTSIDAITEWTAYKKYEQRAYNDDGELKEDHAYTIEEVRERSPTVPSFTKMLTYVEDKDIRLRVELKGQLVADQDAAERLASLVPEHMRSRIIFMSFPDMTGCVDIDLHDIGIDCHWPGLEAIKDVDSDFGTAAMYSLEKAALTAQWPVQRALEEASEIDADYIVINKRAFKNRGVWPLPRFIEEAQAQDLRPMVNAGVTTGEKRLYSYYRNPWFSGNRPTNILEDVAIGMSEAGDIAEYDWDEASSYLKHDAGQSCSTGQCTPYGEIADGVTTYHHDPDSCGYYMGCYEPAAIENRFAETSMRGWNRIEDVGEQACEEDIDLVCNGFTEWMADVPETGVEGTINTISGSVNHIRNCEGSGCVVGTVHRTVETSYDVGSYGVTHAGNGINGAAETADEYIVEPTQNAYEETADTACNNDVFTVKELCN